MVTAEHPRDEFVDHHTATQVIATLDMAVKAQRPFFLGVGMIRPHLVRRKASFKTNIL